MTIYHMKTTGTTGGSGTDANPFKNVNQFIALPPAPGDILEVHGGTYSSPSGGTLASNGTPGSPIIVRAYQDEVPIFNAGAEFRCNANYWTFQGIEFQNYTYVDGSTSIFRVGDNSNNATGIIIQDCDFKPNNKRFLIRVRDGTNITIDGNQMSQNTQIAGTGAHGIFVQKANGLLITNNSFYDHGADGIQLDESATITGVIIRGNTFTSAAETEEYGENGIDVKTVTGSILIESNVFSGYRPTNVDAIGQSGGSTGVAITVHTDGQTDVTITRNKITDCTRGITVSWSSYPSGSAPQGVTLKNNIIELANDFAGNAKRPSGDGRALYFLRVSTDINVYNNSIAQCAKYAVVSNNSAVTFRNNAFRQAGTATVDGGSTIDADYNAYGLNTTRHADFVGAHDVLESTFNWTNYVPAADSPLAEAGVTLASVLEDYNGESRVGGPYDIGAIKALEAEEPPDPPPPDPPPAAAATAVRAMGRSLSQDISISVFQPKIAGGAFIRNLTREVSGYNHDTRAIGGFWSASITLTENPDQISDWIQSGLLRHIVVLSPDLVDIWRGFVNMIRVTMGPLLFSIGPIIDIGNKIRVKYSRTWDTGPPLIGSETITPVASNTVSQLKYGIIERVENLNYATDSQAEEFRDKFLNSPGGGWPLTSRESTLGGGGELSITLECLGYWHWLKTYTFTDVNINTIGRSSKIQSVLAAEPNGGIFSTDYGLITTNNDLVPQNEIDHRTAEDVILSVNQFGIGGERSNIGFYRDERVIYEAVAGEVSYLQYITSNKGITSLSEERIAPWDLRPGRWVLYPDFLPGYKFPRSLAELQADPRAGFIESVRFTAPYDISISGAAYSNLDQLTAKMGLTMDGT